MINRQRENAARAVLLAAHRRKGQKAFRVDRCGPNYRPLLDAEALGWVWFMADDRCGITDAGMRELEPYRRDYERPMLEYVCAVCGRVVADFDRGDGLPEGTSCPDCERETAAAVARLAGKLGADEEAA